MKIIHRAVKQENATIAVLPTEETAAAIEKVKKITKIDKRKRDSHIEEEREIIQAKLDKKKKQPSWNINQASICLTSMVSLYIVWKIHLSSLRFCWGENKHKVLHTYQLEMYSHPPVEMPTSSFIIKKHFEPKSEEWPKHKQDEGE